MCRLRWGRHWLRGSNGVEMLTHCSLPLFDRELPVRVSDCLQPPAAQADDGRATGAVTALAGTCGCNGKQHASLSTSAGARGAQGRRRQTRRCQSSAQRRAGPASGRRASSQPEPARRAGDERCLRTHGDCCVPGWDLGPTARGDAQARRRRREGQAARQAAQRCCTRVMPRREPKSSVFAIAAAAGGRQRAPCGPCAR